MPAPVGRRACQPPRIAEAMRAKRRYSEAVALGRRESSCARDSMRPPRGRRRHRSGRTGYFLDRGPLKANAPGGSPAHLLALGIAPVYSSLAESLRIAARGQSALHFPGWNLPPSEQCANSWARGLALSMVGCACAEALQDSGALQMRGFWCWFSCKWGGERGLDSNSISSLSYFSCMHRFGQRARVQGPMVRTLERKATAASAGTPPCCRAFSRTEQGQCPSLAGLGMCPAGRMDNGSGLDSATDPARRPRPARLP
jgi:hypothetical protein